MGKHKIKKFGALRPNPTGLTEAGYEDGQSHDEFKQMVIPSLNNEGRSQSIQDYVASLLEKLQSPAAEEKACGCQMLTIVASHHKAIDILVQKDVSRIIYPLFLDPSLDVKLNILGAVRNVCVSGNVKVINSLIENDILTPLSALIKHFKDYEPERNKQNDPKKDSKLDVLVQALKLLSVLCEVNPTTVSTFNKEDLLQYVLPKIDPEKYGYPLACAIAQCLHIVSENNPEFSKVVKATDLHLGLLQMASKEACDTDALLFRTLVIGVLLNLTEIDITSHNKLFVEKMSEVLAVNHFDVLKMAIDNEMGTEHKPVEDPTADFDKILQAQGVCLELLANFCCSDDEWEDMDCDMEESSDEQGSGSQIDSEDATVVNDAVDGEENLHLNAELCSSFVENDIISKVLHKISPLDSTMSKNLQEMSWYEKALSSLKELQSRALLCLSNIISAMDVEALSNAVQLQDIWINVYKLLEIAKTSCEKDEDYIWSVTSALRAVIEKMAVFNTPNIGNISTNDLDLLINIGAQSQNHETQINILRTMSAIGCILAAQSQSHPMLNRIGQCLIEVACNNANLAVISEALDSIFDMFKEDHTDVVAREIGLLEKLKSVQLSFKTKLSNERKMLGENYGVVMMAKENLKAFIKYKTKR